jgi:hypothetical protein
VRILTPTRKCGVSGTPILPFRPARLAHARSAAQSRDPSTPLQQASGSLRISAAGFPFGLPSAAPRSRRQIASKCNEALSRDLWPLDPFESAPMRATSSGMGYCILLAIRLQLEIKELAELLSGKAGSNSLPLKKLLCGIFCAPILLQIIT